MHFGKRRGSRMHLSDPTAIRIIQSKFSCMEENMKDNVGKGGCGSKGHFGIHRAGGIQIGEHLPRYAIDTSLKPVDVITVLFLGEPTVEMWEAFADLQRYLKASYPNLHRVYTTSEELKEGVEERYGRSHKEGAMPEVC